MTEKTTWRSEMVQVCDDQSLGANFDIKTDAKKKKKKKKTKKKKPGLVQTDPPSIGLSKIFRTGAYPTGEEVEYQLDAGRMTSAEARERERLAQEDPSTNYQNIRRAAEVHRQVRAYARRTIQPGMTMTEIAEMIENGTRKLVEESGLESGVGFPTGLSVNEVAAHYTPNAGDTKILQKSDVMKVDFGVHVNGRIVDSAFTMNFEPTWDKLLEAVKDATETGVREAGIDVRMCDIGDAIQEVMESYEVEVGGKTHQVKAISNLNGHSIAPYYIHGGKTVPIVKQHGSERDETKMEEGEYFAIETFGSTGRGRVIEDGACSHYALAKDLPEQYNLHHQSARSLLKSIQKNFGTLPFCRRYLDHAGEKNYLLALNTLVKERLVMDYPPLVDPQPGAMTAQFEHTILLRPTCKEIVSRGDDY
ncbi:peptidase M24, structural domain-containing protein [Naematelia encephala]|uniref:Methionine aminopeptidase 2 n=1 Tax=Naematelia encephala TaxID=71784 RepID=A0A1Y2BJ29_9TREE|nr:peptidase M24, structural domain-containing protein [Naematelia encephala]